MNRFLKFLIMAAAVINLVFLFIFDGRIPSVLSLPFVSSAVESEEAVPQADPVQPAEAAVEETQTLPEEAPAEGNEEEMAPEEPEEAAFLPGCRIISGDGSNVRSGPGTGFEVVTSYPYDTGLVLTGAPENGWYPILAEDGTEGYIFESQIEILEDNAEEDVPLAEEINQ